jgi:N-ethylmaleimide reductase
MSTTTVTRILLQPFRLHDLTLRNRIALAPMTRGRAGAARLPNQLMATFRESPKSITK